MKSVSCRATVIDEIELAQQIGDGSGGRGGARYLPPHLHTLQAATGAAQRTKWVGKLEATHDAIMRLERKLDARLDRLERKKSWIAEPR